MVTLKSALSLPLVGLLVACGGSGGGETTGTFSLGVSDNPANVTGVTVAFKQVVLKGEQVFSFDVSDNGAAQQVDLMQFTGAAIAGLISAKQVPVGDYQLCLYVLNNATGADSRTSFVETSGTTEGLVTNSNGTCGGVGGVDEEGVDEKNGTGRLFFNKPFTIAAGENNYVAEFNLEKGLLSPRGNKAYWTLKPTAVQIINNADVGSISGQIGSTVRTACQLDAGLSTGASEFADRVYLYPNNSGLVSSSSPEIKQMVDFRLAEEVGSMDVAPLAASAVTQVLDVDDNITGYEYEFGFVAAGSYSLGYSCLGQNDDQEVNDMQTGAASFSLFSEQTDVVVVSGEGAVRDFLAGDA